MRTLTKLGLSTMAVLAALAAAPMEATAGDRNGRHGGRWDHPGRGWGPPPRAYVAPPPRVYYAPPPPRYYYAPPPRVYYAPPPRYYYAPPPAYYVPAPGVSFNFRF
ncbi:hypothetical protein [Roseomonas sp. HF4]|uniref:hypothetical protein n=1 Tax=Roseomonas sp. HF4 TaxID=2562313 RepID=UPI0010C0AEAF|nr:hypothetical protein [Roseomonas sp. HF4]